MTHTGRVWLDIALCTVTLTVAAICWAAGGHLGLAAAVSLLCVLWAAFDFVDIWRLWRKEVQDHSSAEPGEGPIRPKFPIEWFVISASFQGLAVLALLIRAALISGILIFFFNGGCIFVVNLFYYSGSWKENAHTLVLPTTMLAVTMMMVLSAPAFQFGTLDEDRFHQILMLLVSEFAGGIFGHFLMWFLWVESANSPESKPLQPAEEKAAAASADAEAPEASKV